MSTFGQFIPIQLFGESHGDGVGITINNLPPGIRLNKEKISHALYKRRPKSTLSTPRQEQDEYRIISGYFNDQTTGAPLTIFIPNQDTRSRDYNPDVLRPSHSDYTAKIRYNHANDYRGGGHFSGRLTAPLVILGAICESFLEQKGIYIGSHIASVKELNDESFKQISISKEILKTLNSSDFPVINPLIEDSFKSEILQAKEQDDSVGGTIETAIIGIPAGYGGPYFNTVESLLSSLLYSIPAVKGVEFGSGFHITTLYGSEANDPFVLENGHIKTSSNHSGGIQGGITNGMPLIFRVAIKPTSSIGKPQQTVNIKSMTETTLELKGRHDPAIVHRVVHVINAITNYAIVELLSRKEGLSWIK